MERVLSGRAPGAGDRRGETFPPTFNGSVPGDGGDTPAWSRTRGEYVAADIARGTSRVPYAELHAHSAYSFLAGESRPEAMVEEAHRL